MLRVAEVRREAADSILDAAVDTPTPGWSDGGHAIHLNGWVLGRDAACTSVEVVHGDTTLRTVELGPRPDIAAIPAYAAIPWAEQSGFSTGVGLLGLPESFALEVRAVLPSGERGGIATLRGTRSRLAAHATPALRPLMVSCLGRSGTTLLMELLSGHPSIVVLEPHPYETRCATYWMHMAKVAGEPGPVVPPVAWYDQLSGLDAVRPIPFFGHVPTAEMSWLTSEYTERLADFCVSALGDFYGACARAAGKLDATAFAEKQFPGLLADVLSEVCTAQPEIVSIRDPRDMLLSIFAFLDGGHTVLSHTRGDAPPAIVDRFGQELRLLSGEVAAAGCRRRQVRGSRHGPVRDDPAGAHVGRSLCDGCGDPSHAGDVRGSDERTTSDTGRRAASRAPSDGGAAGTGAWSSWWTPQLEELTVGFGYPASETSEPARVE